MTEPHWAAADEVVPRVAAVLARPGTKTLALPGGATPAPFYATLAGMALPWPTATLLPGDDRDVPTDHDASNFGALKRVFGTIGATLLPLAKGMAVPPLDLAWVGVGLDGHIASLFPSFGKAYDDVTGVVSVLPEPLPPEAPYPRLSLSMATLAAAREIIMVISGDAKRALVETAVRGGDLPVARLLRAAKHPVTIFWSPA